MVSEFKVHIYDYIMQPWLQMEIHLASRAYIHQNQNELGYQAFISNGVSKSAMQHLK